DTTETVDTNFNCCHSFYKIIIKKMKLFACLQISPQNYKFRAKLQRKSEFFCVPLSVSHWVLAFGGKIGSIFCAQP
ncbi:MAG: hypothetical protein IIX34_07155, partial [Alistipes sp.]|nr:hypothetical protein [Alistipes sp.]